jgi:hypothetical protein
MRPLLAALALALACTPTAEPPTVRAEAPAPPLTRTLALPGVAIEVPSAFIPLGPEHLAVMRGALQREIPPDATILVDGMRDAGGAQGCTVYLQQIMTSRDTAARPRTVRQVLTRTREDVETRVIADGGEILRIEFAERDAGLEGCLTTRTHAGARNIDIRACTRFSVPDAGHITMVQVMCIANERDLEAVCAPIIASHRFEPSATLDLDAVLPANAPPPIPLSGVGRDRVAGLRFGMTRDEFVAACRRSGFAADAVDWAAELPVTRKWFEEGRMARCEGLPGAPADFTLGPVPRTVAVFVDGRLAVATLHLSADIATAEAHLIAAYPEFVFTPRRVLYRIDDDAHGDDLMRVGLDTAGPDGGSAVHFVSERGAHGPPVELSP